MIRDATVNDIPALLDMGMRFHAGSAYAKLIEPSRLAVQATLKSLIELPIGCVIVDERDGALVGAILGVLVPHFITGQQIATELSWWVDPEHRGAGLRLMERLEEWARDRGAKFITMVEPPENPRVGQLYERHGYMLLEKSYMKAL